MSWPSALVACGRIGFDVSSNDPDAPAALGSNDSGALGDDGSTVQPPPNDICMNAIDVTAGGTFMATTCGANDEYTNSCFAAGAPDVWYVVQRGAGGGIINYFLSVTPGFNTKTDTGLCGDSVLTNCTINQIASQGNMTYRIVVESETAGCGEFTLTVALQ